MIRRHLQSGFSAVELLITLFIAAAFLISGYQLYSLVIKDSAEVQMQTRANNIADNYLQKYKGYATNPCTSQTPLTNSSITADGLSNVHITINISCPYSANTTVSQVTSTVTYDTSLKVVKTSTYTEPSCPSGFIVVPGSKTYNTDDFCVMKYEAKDGGYGNAVSTAAGTPLVNVPQTNDDINVSQGTTATSALLVDGATASGSYYDGAWGTPTSVLVNMNSIKSIDRIVIWHYWADYRTYHSNKTEVSADGTNWTTVFDSSISGEYAETAMGHTITFDAMNIRYIRDTTNGSSANAGNHWVEIQAYSPQGAFSKSTAVCDSCHLITEAEWLTIAQNVLSVASNWSGGVVGTGYIYSGHNDNAPASALTASTDDSQGYYGETNTGGNQRRTLTLTNGEVIWDLAGNVSEWTAGQTASEKPGIAHMGYAVREWTAITVHGNILPDPFPSFANSAASSWTSANGIGEIYSNADDSSGLRAFTRSGMWADGATAGIFELYLGNPINGSYGASTGFRVAASLN